MLGSCQPSMAEVCLTDLSISTGGDLPDPRNMPTVAPRSHAIIRTGYFCAVHTLDESLSDIMVRLQLATAHVPETTSHLQVSFSGPSCCFLNNACLDSRAAGAICNHFRILGSRRRACWRGSRGAASMLKTSRPLIKSPTWAVKVVILWNGRCCCPRTNKACCQIEIQHLRAAV